MSIACCKSTEFRAAIRVLIHRLHHVIGGRWARADIIARVPLKSSWRRWGGGGGRHLSWTALLTPFVVVFVSVFGIMQVTRAALLFLLVPFLRLLYIACAGLSCPPTDGTSAQAYEEVASRRYY